MPNPLENAITQGQPPGGQGSAKAIIDAALARYGLTSLSSWAWQAYTSGSSNEQIMLDMKERPEYAKRFPAMKALSDAGVAISEAQYVQYESSVKAQFQAAGLPAGFYDEPEDFQRLLESNVSVAEVQSRVQKAQAAIFTATGAQREQLDELYGAGATPGQITAFFIDPDRAEPLLERAWNAAVVSGTGITSGYGKLSRDEAEKVANRGLTPDAVGTGFEKLVTERELYSGQLGAHADGFGDVSRDEQLGAAFGGDAAADRRIKEEAARRKSQFQQGGGYTKDKTGVAGLGTDA